MSTLDDDYDDDDFSKHLEDDDYLFIIDKDGMLKSVLLPEDYSKENLPDTIAAVLTLFGVSDIVNEKPHLH